MVSPQHMHQKKQKKTFQMQEIHLGRPQHRCFGTVADPWSGQHPGEAQVEPVAHERRVVKGKETRLRASKTSSSPGRGRQGRESGREESCITVSKLWGVREGHMQGHGSMKHETKRCLPQK